MERVFKEDIRTDMTGLHFEWAIYPELVHYYGERLAEAKHTTDNTKESLDVIRAQRALWIRQNKTKADGKPLTEAQVVEELTIDPEHREAIGKLSEAKHSQGLIQAAYDAIMAKKNALENWVRLHGQEYFSTPVEPKEYESWKGERFSQTAEAEVKTQANSNMQEASRRRGRRT